MKKISIILSLSLLSFNVLASGLNPFCKFTKRVEVNPNSKYECATCGNNGNNSAFGPDSKYKLSEAYAASDIVVVGQYKRNQDLVIEQIIKGKASKVSLVATECKGTACTGLSLPEKMSFVFLLRRETSGLYNKVDGDGNDICPSVFEIKDSKAMIGKELVPVKDLDKFLKSKREIPLF